MGLDSLPEPQRRSWDKALQDARAKQHQPDIIASQVLDKARALTDSESASIAQAMAESIDEYETLTRDITAKVVKGESAEDLLASRSVIERRYQALSDATRLSGTEAARSLAIRRLSLTKDFKRLPIMAEARAMNKGADIPKAQRATLEAATEKIANLEAELVGLRAELDRQYKSTSKTPGVRNPNTELRAKALATNIRKRLGIESGTPNVFQTHAAKRAGRIDLGGAEMERLAREVRAFVKTKVEQGTVNSLDDALTALRSEAPSVGDEDWLSILSGKYRAGRIEADIEKLRINKSMRELRAMAEYREQPMMYKAVSVAGEILNGIARSMKAGFDMSILLIQGRKALATNPGVWIKAWGPQLKAIVGGEEAVLRSTALRQAQPMYRRAVQAGVQFTETGSMHRQEEMFLGRLTSFLRGTKTGRPVGEVMYRQEASATEALNELRAGLFDKMTRWDPQGTEFMKDIADMVNVMTGRPIGALKPIAQSKIAGNAAFAPGYWASKFQYATFQPIWGARTLKGAAANSVTYAKQIGAYAAAIITAKTFLEGSHTGYVETDPRSTDYGNMTVGDHTFNLFAQDGEVAKVLAQVFAGKVNRAGKYSAPGYFNTGDVLWNYTTGKFAPLPRAIKDRTMGVYDPQLGGSRKQTSADLGKAFAPMAFERWWEGQTDGPDATLLLNILNDADRRKIKPFKQKWEWSWDRIED